MATSVPELPEQWQSLAKGVQGDEKQWERGTLENTVKVAKACREAGMKFFWIGYDVFREDYPMTELDEAQYGYWSKAFKSSEMTKEEKQWDVDLVDDLSELKQPEDSEFLEFAHQSSFVGTPLKLMLERAGIKTIILCGIHLD